MVKWRRECSSLISFLFFLYNVTTLLVGAFGACKIAVGQVRPGRRRFSINLCWKFDGPGVWIFFFRLEFLFIRSWGATFAYRGLILA